MSIQMHDLLRTVSAVPFFLYVSQAMYYFGLLVMHTNL